MKTRLIPVMMMAIGVLTSAFAADDGKQQDTRVEANGLRIVKPAPGGNDKMRAFNWNAGTALALLINRPQGGIVEFEKDSSKVLSFTDDKGKDLSKKETKDRFGSDRAEFGMMPDTSEDGKLCAVEVTAPGTPSKGATAITVSGQIGLLVATQKKDFTAEKVDLKFDTAVSAGAIPFKITQVGKPEWGGSDNAFSVTLEAKQDLQSVADIQFFDAEGKNLGATRGGSQKMGFGGNVVESQSFNFKTKVDTARIVITYWTDMKKVSVPFKVVTGVGL